ncbi:MAG: hypothetical protein LQ339_006751 [Xanthoria mediterranea]|nr:MAG: hypothetical protein LQ339_006751 [Xanthoria mediterranea]
MSSRGCVPHLSQDTMKADTNIRGIYAALEDFIEKSVEKIPVIHDFPLQNGETRLRRFIALQEDALLVTGPRRHPPVPARAANTNTGISIQTALGFSTLESDDYVEAVQRMRPDIVLSMADYEYSKRPGVKRVEKMGDRTLAWFHDLVAGFGDETNELPQVALFAPVLPIEAGQQSVYLNTLQQDLAKRVSGWVLYDAASIDAIPTAMRHLPRFGLTDVRGPHEILDQVSLGLDAFVLSFIGDATDAGIALTFTFPSPERSESRSDLALGIDMWPSTHVSDVSPLVEDCTCYACRNHHRAFIRHLLDAKEMLAWVLLQVHNHHTIDIFFANVRQSIRRGTFERDCEFFDKTFQRDFPVTTGKGPRLRGYHVKSGPAEPRRNPPAFQSLEDAHKRLAEAPLPSSAADGEDLERQGFAEKLT